MSTSYKAALANAGVGYLPLYANRHQSAGFSVTFWFEDIDLTASTVAGEVRQYPDQGGSPLATFTVGTKTLVAGATGIPISLTKAIVSDLPAPGVSGQPGEAGDNVTFYYDIWVNGVVTLAGEFVVVGGVKQ